MILFPGNSGRTYLYNLLKNYEWDKILCGKDLKKEYRGEMSFLSLSLNLHFGLDGGGCLRHWRHVA